MTVNRVCGSGAQAIVSAAHEILMGSVDTAVAGGMENMDAAPYLVPRGRWGHRTGDGVLYDSMLRDGLNDAFSDAHSGWHTEELVPKFQIGRTSQDEWALRSHQRFSAAQAAGKFADEIVPVEVSGRKGTTTFMVDEHNRPDATIEALSKLKPVFRDGGTITAGSAPGLNTAAAAMVLASEAWADSHGVRTVARLVSYGIAAVEPGLLPRPDPSGQTSPFARRLEPQRCRAYRNQRSLRRYNTCSYPGTRAAARHRECRWWRHRTRPSDRRDRCCADNPSSPFDASRRAQEGHRHDVHRWWPRDRAGRRDDRLAGELLHINYGAYRCSAYRRPSGPIPQALEMMHFDGFYFEAMSAGHYVSAGTSPCGTDTQKSSASHRPG